MTSPCCLCVCPSPPNVARQQLGEHIPAPMNTHATIEKHLDAVSSMRKYLICSERREGNYVLLPEGLVIFLSIHLSSVEIGDYIEPI
jgi:hypothetical protein